MAPRVRHLLAKSSLGAMHGYRFARLLSAAKTPVEAQRKVLSAILSANGRTAFGKRHGFDAIRNADEYSRAVPVHTYEDLRADIEAQESTGEARLTQEQPVYYNRTSGTVASPKNVPVTASGLKRIQGHQQLAAYSFSRWAGLFGGKMFAVTGAAVEGHMPGGVPPEIGTTLKPQPGRAAKLGRILDARGKLSYADIWPRLSGVVTWTGGSCGVAIRNLRPALPPSCAIIELGYVASEVHGTVNVDPRRNLCLPNIDHTFFEFAPRADWEAGGDPELLDLPALQEGEEYYVIVTTADGIYRYDMNDIVRVTGRVHATPTLDFVQKGQGVANITGEKLHESQVLSAVGDALEATDLVAVFFIVLADAESASYTLYVEPRQDAIPDPRLAALVDAGLRSSNIEYESKRASGRLEALRIGWLRGGYRGRLPRAPGRRWATRRAVQVPASPTRRGVRFRLPAVPSSGLSFGDAHPPIRAIHLSRAVQGGVQARFRKPRPRGEPDRRGPCQRQQRRVRRGLPAPVCQRRNHCQRIALHPHPRRNTHQGCARRVESARLDRGSRRRHRPKPGRVLRTGDRHPRPTGSGASGKCVEELVGVPKPRTAFRYSAVLGNAPHPAFLWQLRRYRKRGFADFKVKLSGDAGRDRRKVGALAGTAARVRVDANNLWTSVDDCVDHLASLPGEVFAAEEPLGVGDLKGFRAVGDATLNRIVPDESLLRAEQLESLTDAERWIANIRVSKMGGILRSMAIAERAARLGIGTIVGCQVGETSLLTRAALPVMQAAGSNLVAAEGAFGTHLLRRDLTVPCLMFGDAGLVDPGQVPDRPGLGLTVARHHLEPLDEL